MAIFKRKNIAPVTPVGDGKFSRLHIRQVIIFGDFAPWSMQVEFVFLHYEKSEKNFLNVRLQDGTWNSLEVADRATGEAKMIEFRDNWKSAITIGLLPAGYIYSPSYPGIRNFGFVSIDFSKPLTQFNADEIFSLGRELDEKLQQGWFPSTEYDLSLTFNFLALAPLRVGFFGSYKYILKELTDRFPENLGNMSLDYASHISAAIGFGYGKCEGFLSRGKLAPESEYSWEMDEINSHTELGGSRYPRLKTLQFLMRKGGRFLNYLDSECDPLIATRFKSHVLRGADANHQESNLNEEYYLMYQQLTTRIIYGDSGLAIRDREARKVNLAPRYERHNYALSSDFVNSLSAPEIQAYKNWIAGLDGKSPAVTNYALALSIAVPEIEFDFNAKVVSTLFNSESVIAKKAIWSAIQENPTLLRFIPAASVVKFIEEADPAQFGIIATEIRSCMWLYQSTINIWVANHVGKKLNDYEVQVATEFLLAGWDYISNDTWNEGIIPLRDTLLIQIAAQTQLQPFEPWKAIFASWQRPKQYFLGFYGLATNVKYPKGLLDVLDLNSGELIHLLALQVVAAMTFSGYDSWCDTHNKYYSKCCEGVEELIEFLMVFNDSSKGGAKEILWTILGKQMLPPEKQSIFIEHLNSLDSSGAVYLKALSTAIALGDEKVLLRYLVTLSEESKDPFWRRNKGEAETILMGWKSFPQFYWSNLEAIPPKGIEKLRKFEGLQAKLLKIITPHSIARLNTIQIDEFVAMVRANASFCSNTSLLRAMITAPSATINEIAAKYVKDENKYSAHWLLMLESNLPISQESALRYLESQVEAKDFSAKLLMALDSNNAGARKRALSVLASIKTPSVLGKVVDGLVENRNSDTWKVVSQNLELISGTDKYKEFTNQVFLSRRKGRKVKEEIKFDIDELIEDISEAVEQDTLIRMAHSSVASDRDWALKQIALRGGSIDGVTVERSWKGSLNV